MNRVIKFRCWNGERMDYGGFVIHATEGKLIPLDCAPWITEDAKAMQYTGLKDKNGLEIYEGDVVEFTGKYFTLDHSQGYHGGLGVVVFESGSFCIDYDGDIIPFLSLHRSKVERLGNIHQNPELLEREA